MHFYESIRIVAGILGAWFANPYETGGVIFGIVCVWLTTRENIWCWPTGLVNVVLYIIVFYQARLYSDMGLQVIYVILCLYGWYEWLHGGKDHGHLTVTRTPFQASVVLALAGSAFAFLLGALLKRNTNADLPFLDSSLSSFSLVAQWMQTKKWLESWIVWISVDVIYIGMYIYKQLYPTAGLYAVFLILATIGFDSWRKSFSKSAA